MILRAVHCETFSSYLKNEKRGAKNCFDYSKKSPSKQWQQECDALVFKAFQAQRNGAIRLYSSLTSEAETLRRKIDQLKKTDGG